MKYTLTLLLIIAVQATIGWTRLHQTHIRLSANPKHTLKERQNVMANQEIRRDRSPVYKGTNPQPADAGVSRADVNYRIINGDVARRGQFPWQAAITMDDRDLCGGSLISEQWVLTAAHCADPFATFSVTLGATNLWFNESGAITQVTRSKMVHPEYTAQTLRNDIALLWLPVSLVSNTYMSAVRLPTASQVGESFEGSSARISGWGRTKGDGEKSNFLNFVDVTVIPNKQCAIILGDDVVASNICTLGMNGKSPCNGDSGGPLVIQQNDGRYTQVGIVSFGIRGCFEDYPAAYTRVTSYLEWISSTANISIAA